MDQVSANIPSTPAFETAAASSGTADIGAWTIGCSIPSSSQTGVRIASTYPSGLAFRFASQHRAASLGSGPVPSTKLGPHGYDCTFTDIAARLARLPLDVWRGGGYTQSEGARDSH